MTNKVTWTNATTIHAVGVDENEHIFFWYTRQNETCNLPDHQPHDHASRRRRVRGVSRDDGHLSPGRVEGTHPDRVDPTGASTLCRVGDRSALQVCRDGGVRAHVRERLPRVRVSPPRERARYHHVVSLHSSDRRVETTTSGACERVGGRRRRTRTTGSVGKELRRPPRAKRTPQRPQVRAVRTAPRTLPTHRILPVHERSDLRVHRELVRQHDALPAGRREDAPRPRTPRSRRPSSVVLRGVVGNPAERLDQHPRPRVARVVVSANGLLR